MGADVAGSFLEVTEWPGHDAAELFEDADRTIAALRNQVGGLAQSTEFFQKAVRIGPLPGEAYYNLAVALQRGGDLNQALQHYRQATTLQARSA